MGRPLRAALVFASLAAMPALAQTPGPPPPAADDPEVMVRTVTGCVTQSGSGNKLTLSDVKNGTYELVESDVRKYIGKRVEAKGTSRRLHIVGGLWPTPNVAAQAGAMDPLEAMRAAMPGGPAYGTGVEPAVEFRVEKIRSVKGRCP